MRLISLLILALAVASAALAGGPARAETTTYIDGNLAGVTPQTGGTLLFSDDKAMYLRTGLATIPVPYANISKAELGGKQTHSHNVKAYKVWALGKGKTQTQLLLIDFKNEDGEDKSMTLELAPGAAANVVSTINSHHSASPTEAASASTTPPTPAAPAATAENSKSKKSKKETAKLEKADKNKKKSKTEAASVKPEPKPEQWWGDDYWKTSRNASKWEQASSDKSAAAAKTAATDKPAAPDKASQSQR